MKKLYIFFTVSVALSFFINGCSFLTEHSMPKEARDALRMIKSSEGLLVNVYAPLAEQIAREYQLANKGGIGIDIGSGPGTLVIELCKRTKLHWINADINPYFFP